MSATSILTGTTGGFNLLEGIFGMNAADAQADSLRSQLGLMRAESEADIKRYAENAEDFKKKQAMAYMKSGVTLEGSPLDILDETVRVSSENIAAMRAKTSADVLGAKSKISALRGAGRAALVSGVTEGLPLVAKSAYDIYKSTTTKKTGESADTGFAPRGTDEGSYR